MQGRLALAALIGMMVGACRANLEQECNPGSEGCECSDEGECIGDLMCLSNLCVAPEDTETGAETAVSEESTSNDSSSTGDGDGDSSSTGDGDGDSSSTGDGDGDGDGDDSSTGDGDLPAPDDFDGSSLARAWSVLNPGSAAVSFDGDRILLDPEPGTVWWQDGQSILVYQEVSGDFMVTADVTSTNLAETAPPGTGFRLGGLMMRNGVTAAENYVALVVGGGDTAVVVETKTTTNSISSLGAFEWPAGTGQFRICRFGNTFRLLGRDGSGDDWMQLEDYIRDDLPAQLQTGLVAYANLGTPDLRVASDRIEFAPVSGLDDCQN